MTAPQSIRQVFTNAGYDEPTLAKRLELSSQRLRFQNLAKHLHATRALTPLDVLIRLFLLRQTVPRDLAHAALTPTALTDWADAGLLKIGASEVTAAVEVMPIQGVLVAADWPDITGVEPVMGIAASTRALAQVMIRRHTPRVLDLGCGCGILSLLASAQSDQVVAVDLNPRAVETTRFNAQLNGLGNIECLPGDLFAPVQGRAFDLILCNPPFVIGPGGGRLHTQAGRPVDQLCRDIVQQAPAFLVDGGYCQIVCNWAHLNGADDLERLASWFEGTGCDAWVLRSHTEDAATYAQNRVAEVADSPETAARLFDSWIAYCEKEAIEAISFGVITFRKTSEQPNWFRCESLAGMPRPSGAAIEARFQQCDLLRRYRDDADLLACRFRAAENLRWEQVHELGDDGWTTVESRLTLKGGAALGANADRAVVDFVVACTGDRTLGHDLQQIAQTTGQEIERLAPGFLQVVRRLVELGYLRPVDG